MRPIIPLFTAVAAFCLLPSLSARADDALYRCEAADGSVSIQGVPCPKGVNQRKIPFDRPPQTTAPAPPAVQAPPVVPIVAGHPVTPASALHGPNDPYPLWNCMRADGSTYDSRDGRPGRQWVAKAEASPASVDPDQAAADAKLVERMKKGVHVVHPYVPPASGSDDAAADAAVAPPPGSPPGQWVDDQCEQLDPAQACQRFATRRDALRKEIYAAKPSDRALYSPEEQDLTSMLYAACGR